MEDLENTDLVLVYGTLMKGERNAHFLDEADLIDGDVITAEASYLMQQFNSSSSKGKATPGVQRGSYKMRGELYQVNEEQLIELDRLEQNGVRYEREVVSLQDGRKAWLYVLIADEAPAENQNLIKTNNGVQEWVRGIAL